MAQSVGNEKNGVRSSGKTVKDAIGNGLAQLNLREDQVEIEVIKEGSRGILGFGAEDAVVELRPKPQPAAGETVAPVEPTSLTSVSEPEAAPVTPSETEPETVAPPEPEATTSTASAEETALEEQAKVVLETLLEKMAVEAAVSVRLGEDLVEPDEEPPLTLDITGKDLGVLIGRQGETLRSLQFVLRQILSKEAGHWVPVVVDVESYLVRRRSSLQQLADRMADRVATSNRKVTLEPMPAQERRIIHLQLRDHEAVYTQSIGDGDRRKVVIYPK